MPFSSEAGLAPDGVVMSTTSSTTSYLNRSGWRRYFNAFLSVILLARQSDRRLR